MILEVILGYAAAICLVGIVYMIGVALERAADAFLRDEQENVPLRITAAALGREFANNHGSFQDRYYLRVMEVSGKISGIKIIPSSNSSNKQHVILDGVICCEFNEVQRKLHNGMNVDIQGLCAGKILIGCEVRGL